MRETYWTVKTPANNSMIVGLIENFAVVWSSVGVSQAIVHNAGYVNYFGASKHIDHHMDRFPEQSGEEGLYTYACSYGGRDCLIPLLYEMWNSGNTLPLKSGPAVIDVPILHWFEIDNAIRFHNDLKKPYCVKGYTQYFRQLYFNAVNQFMLFPAELRSRLSWYEDRLYHEMQVYDRVARTSSM